MKAFANKTGRLHDMRWIRIGLSAERRQIWIQTKRFKRLKEELNLYNNVLFGCLTHPETGACQYYFFTDSEDAENRILNFAMELGADENTRKHIWSIDKEPVDTFSAMPRAPVVNSCPLF